MFQCTSAAGAARSTCATTSHPHASLSSVTDSVTVSLTVSGLFEHFSTGTGAETLLQSWVHNHQSAPVPPTAPLHELQPPAAGCDTSAACTTLPRMQAARPLPMQRRCEHLQQQPAICMCSVLVMTVAVGAVTIHVPSSGDGSDTPL
jgi:hypothetical protein